MIHAGHHGWPLVLAHTRSKGRGEYGAGLGAPLFKGRGIFQSTKWPKCRGLQEIKDKQKTKRRKIGLESAVRDTRSRRNRSRE